jgi:hypothetical protein
MLAARVDCFPKTGLIPCSYKKRFLLVALLEEIAAGQAHVQTGSWLSCGASVLGCIAVPCVRAWLNRGHDSCRVGDSAIVTANTEYFPARIKPRAHPQNSSIKASWGR